MALTRTLNLTSILHLSQTRTYSNLAIGSGSFYKLGHGDISDRQSPRPIKQLGGKMIVDIHAGFYHSCCVTSNGSVMTWGGGIYGKLGHGNTENSGFPQIIKALNGKRMIRMNCSPLFTMACTVTGEAYTWGYGTKGSLGHGDQSNLDLPKKIETLSGKKVSLLSAVEIEMTARITQMEGVTSTDDVAQHKAAITANISKNNKMQYISAGPYHNIASSLEGS